MRVFTRRWHSRWHTSRALPALALAAVAFETSPAAADCTLPEPAIVWSHPAQGDTGVPTNADLWLQTSGWGEPARVWLGNEELPALPLPYGYDLGELQPNTEHTLRVAPSGSGVSFELSFTTGAGPAAPDPAAAPGAVTPSRSSDYDASPLCQAALDTQDCFDTGQNTYFAFTPSTNATGWLIESDGGYRPTNLWPGECGAPRLFAHDFSSPCVTLHAIDEAGATHASERICSGAVSNEPDASCGLPTTPGSAPTPLSLIGLAAVLGWRVRGRRR